METYVIKSLETHLFFARIMKEHSLFLLAAFPEKDKNYKRQADYFRIQFEKILETAVCLANGMIGEKVLSSGEIVTEYTEQAEWKTSKFTGIPINFRITRAEKNLREECGICIDRKQISRTETLNRKARCLVEGLISLKENILQDVLACEIYTANYPLLIEHIIREAKWYQSRLCDLEKGRFNEEEICGAEAFWDQIMMEHAEFIRGLLDPTECELRKTANDFANDYCALLEETRNRDQCLQKEFRGKTLQITNKYRDFKTDGVKGILACEIRSVILPLLADHVLREANHYIRILE